MDSRHQHSNPLIKHPPNMPSDSPSQSVSSAISGRRSTIALFIPGIPTNPLRIRSLSSSFPCYWSTCNQHRSKRIVFTKRQALLTSTYSSHQFPSLFLHVNSQECPQTARRNQSHQQSVEGEVQLRFSSQAFQPIHLESTHCLQAYHATGLPAINIAPRELCSQAASTTYTYSSHQFPSLFLHVNSQECPQTARRNQSHQQSVEGEVQLRFSSQAFQPIHLESTHCLQAYHATGLPAINIAPRELCSQAASTTYTYSSHQFPSLFLHVKGHKCPQTARRNQSHQQSVEGEVQLRFSSQAFQPIHSESAHSLQAYHATCLPTINIAPRELCSRSGKHYLHLLTVVTSFRPCFCMSIAKNALRQPVAISLISNQWKEKYNCAFHPRHSNQSTQNPLTLFKLTMLLVYLQSISLQKNCIHKDASTTYINLLAVVTSFRPCFCMSKAKNALRQPVAISLISNQWKEKYNCAFHPRHSNQSTQNPLTLFKLTMLLVYLQSTSLQENCVHEAASTTYIYSE